MTTLDSVNAKYNDETYDVFPFIAKNRITPLKAGLYKKHKASFRGITAVYNPDEEEYEFPLYGMYNVPEDIVIVPEDLELNPSKSSFLAAYIAAGYKQVTQAPKFKPVLFPSDSEEAQLALANKAQFHYDSISSK